jgi:hypothetical protein
MNKFLMLCVGAMMTASALGCAVGSDGSETVPEKEEATGKTVQSAKVEQTQAVEQEPFQLDLRNPNQALGSADFTRVINVEQIANVPKGPPGN